MDERPFWARKEGGKMAHLWNLAPTPKGMYGPRADTLCGQRGYWVLCLVRLVGGERRCDKCSRKEILR